MKENEVAISFSESFIRDKLTLPSVDGGSFELYIIEMPDEEGEDQEIKRTFTVPVKYLYTDSKHSFIRFTYLLKDKYYRVMRAMYDSENRVTRCMETNQMTGQEIADVFKRYRARKSKKFEESLTAKERKKVE